MLLRELEPEKFWSFPTSYSKERQKNEIEKMIINDNYYFQQKIDGNYSAFICDFDGDKRLISRGISKVTGEYGRLEDKIFFFDAVSKVFNKPTRIMGEIWLEGAIDRNIGSILRANTEKSLSIQDNDYYQHIQSTIKFTAKDRRDIENNEFRGQKLRWYIFDVWYYNGEDLTQTPWIERQEYVRRAVKEINHPLVTCAQSYKMDENFYNYLSAIFANGGEGVVCYNEQGLPEPGKRTAHKTLKVKRELENLIDCFILRTEPAVKAYTGKEPGTWQFWENARTGEKLVGNYFGEYQAGQSVIPVSKGYFYNLPGAIYVGVYNNKGEVVELCKVAGLTDDFKTELRDNFNKYYMCPVTIGGMMLSNAKNELSIRHPYLHSIRLNDIDPKDCTLTKILENN